MSQERTPLLLNTPHDGSLSTKTARNPKSTVFHSERTDMSESKMMVTAEEVTTIVPDMPQTCRITGKSAKVLVWKDLIVSVPIMGKQKFFERIKFWKKQEFETSRREVLHQISGVAEPGEILAIMGASGAGKTTLLNVLTQRNQKSLEVSGDVTVNGEQLTIGEFQRMSSYVQQADIFMGAVTVREHLIFSARLRMGRRFTDAQKIARVDEVITQMNLVGCQNTMIGQRHEKSISLGEKKRLSFGCEILTDPSILFCDEPTSGLDAFMAKQVIKALEKLAKQGKTIVITIHQPSSQIFNMFDKLCLMALGQIIFLGPPKKATGIFREAGYPMAGRDNPAEFCIQKLAVHDGETEEDRKERVADIKKTYDNSNMASLYFERIYGPVSERRKEMGNKDVRKSHKYAANWFTQVLWLFVRSFRASLRDPLLLKVRFAQTILISVAVGVVYLRLGHPHGDIILSINGFLFSCVRDNFGLLIFPCLTVFADEMPVFLRENHANIYSTDAYFIAKNLAELPLYIILPIIYSIIVFFMAGIHDDQADQFFTFMFVNIFVSNVAVSVAYAAACIFGTVAIASQILPMIMWPVMCFGGFFVDLNRIPPAMNWLKHLSFHRYAFEIQMINKWEIHGSELIEGCLDPNSTSWTNDTEGKSCDWGSDGFGILAFFGFEHTSIYIYRNFGILFFCILLCRSIALIALFIRVRLVR